MKLLPFDLQRALAGDKVVTRDGREVFGIHKFDAYKDPRSLFGVMEGNVLCWELNGVYAGVLCTRELDLFMAPKTVKRWVNFYPDYYGALDYPTAEQAKVQAHSGAIAIAVPVEFEEGYGCE